MQIRSSPLPQGVFRMKDPVAEEICEQLVAQAGGDPLALVELPTVLTIP